MASVAEHVSEVSEHNVAIANRCLDIVRAVAGLLYNMRAIKTEDNNFDADYKQGLEYYPKLCEEMVTTDRGQVSHRRQIYLDLDIS